MSGVPVGLIWAEADGGVIGAGGAVPWQLPEDLAVFRAVTAGAAVVMGRRTWESLPPRFRPLPGRRNLVLSRDPGWSAPGAERLADPASVEDLSGPVWVIGGSEVYAALLERASVAVITRVRIAVAGDAYAPVLGPGWREPAAGPWTGERRSRYGLAFAVTIRLRDGGSLDPAVTAAVTAALASG